MATDGSSKANKRTPATLDDDKPRKRSKTDEGPIVATVSEYDMMGNEVVRVKGEGSSSSRDESVSNYVTQYKGDVKYLGNDMVASIEGYLSETEADDPMFSYQELLGEYRYENDDDGLAGLDVDMNDLVEPDAHGSVSIWWIVELVSYTGLLSCEELAGFVTGEHIENVMEVVEAAYAPGSDVDEDDDEDDE